MSRPQNFAAQVLRRLVLRHALAGHLRWSRALPLLNRIGGGQ